VLLGELAATVEAPRSDVALFMNVLATLCEVFILMIAPLIMIGASAYKYSSVQIAFLYGLLGL